MKEVEKNCVVVKKQFRNYRVSINQSDKINYLISDEIKKNLFELIRNPKSNLILNLSNIKFIDSSGLAVLDLIARVSEIVGSTFTVIKANSEIVELFELAKHHRGIRFNYIETNKPNSIM